MPIEINHLSITSNVVQRQQGVADDGAEVENERTSSPDADWRVECRRMILDLLEQRRER
jgi:hypothetical protein